MHSRFRKDLVQSREGLRSLDARLDIMQTLLNAAKNSNDSQDTTIAALQLALDVLSDELASHIAQVDLIQLNTSLAEEDAPTTIGAFYWDPGNNTAAINLGNTVTLNLGEELFAPRCTNKTGVDIPNGSIVYVSGSQGNRPTIELASSDSFEAVSKVLGITTEPIANNADGRVTISGTVRDVDTSLWPEGTCLYLSTEPGEYVDATPIYGYNRVKIGLVTRQHAVHGTVCIKVTTIPYMFGSPYAGNYAYFEDDGTLINMGEAKCVLDEFGSLIGQKLESPSSNIQYNLVEATVDFDTRCSLTDYVVMSSQLNHDYDLTTPVGLHLHWKQNQAATPNILIGYRWQVNGQPWVTPWTNIAATNQVFSYTSGTLLQIATFAAVAPPTPIGVSSILQLRLYRDVNNDSGLFAGADNYTGDMQAVFLDLHKTVDSFGSRTAYSK